MMMSRSSTGSSITDDPIPSIVRLSVHSILIVTGTTQHVRLRTAQHIIRELYDTYTPLVKLLSVDTEEAYIRNADIPYVENDVYHRAAAAITQTKLRLLLTTDLRPPLVVVVSGLFSDTDMDVITQLASETNYALSAIVIDDHPTSLLHISTVVRNSVRTVIDRVQSCTRCSQCTPTIGHGDADATNVTVTIRDMDVWTRCQLDHTISDWWLISGPDVIHYDAFVHVLHRIGCSIHAVTGELTVTDNRIGLVLFIDVVALYRSQACKFVACLYANRNNAHLRIVTNMSTLQSVSIIDDGNDTSHITQLQRIVQSATPFLQWNSPTADVPSFIVTYAACARHHAGRIDARSRQPVHADSEPTGEVSADTGGDPRIRDTVLRTVHYCVVNTTNITDVHLQTIDTDAPITVVHHTDGDVLDVQMYAPVTPQSAYDTLTVVDVDADVRKRLHVRGCTRTVSMNTYRSIIPCPPRAGIIENLAMALRYYQSVGINQLIIHPLHIGTLVNLRIAIEDHPLLPATTLLHGYGDHVYAFYMRVRTKMRAFHMQSITLRVLITGRCGSAPPLTNFDKGCAHIESLLLSGSDTEQDHSLSLGCMFELYRDAHRITTDTLSSINSGHVQPLDILHIDFHSGSTWSMDSLQTISDGRCTWNSQRYRYTWVTSIPHQTPVLPYIIVNDLHDHTTLQTIVDQMLEEHQLTMGLLIRPTVTRGQSIPAMMLHTDYGKIQQHGVLYRTHMAYDDAVSWWNSIC